MVMVYSGGMTFSINSILNGVVAMFEDVDYMAVFKPFTPSDCEDCCRYHLDDLTFYIIVDAFIIIIDMFYPIDVFDDYRKD